MKTTKDVHSQRNQHCKQPPVWLYLRTDFVLFDKWEWRFESIPCSFVWVFDMPDFLGIAFLVTTTWSSLWQIISPMYRHFCHTNDWARSPLDADIFIHLLTPLWFRCPVNTLYYYRPLRIPGYWQRGPYSPVRVLGTYFHMLKGL